MLQIRLEKSVAVGSFLLKARYDQASWNAGWYVSGRKDGTNFKVLYTGTNSQGATENTNYIPQSDIKPYSYYRFDGTAATLNLNGMDKFILYYASLRTDSMVISGLSDPVSSSDCAIKNYVDS